jgi:hypothetical protein
MRTTRNAFLTALLAALAAVPLPAPAESACEAIGAADFAALGFAGMGAGGGRKPAYVVKLDSNAAISGLETECLWNSGPGSVTLLLGDMDANLVKGDDVRRLGQKVLAGVREFHETAAKYSGRPVTIAPLPGVGDEAYSARFDASFFEVWGRRGLRLARLKVSTTRSMKRTPTAEEAGALLGRILAHGSGYTTSGAPAIQGEAPWSGPGDRYVVTGSIVATGALNGTFTWSSPGEVQTYPDRTEIVLAAADKSAYMNLQVWNGEDRVEVRSGKLRSGFLRGSGRVAKVDPLAGSGEIRVDATVKSATETVTVRGTLTVRPARKK